MKKRISKVLVMIITFSLIASLIPLNQTNISCAVTYLGKFNAEEFETITTINKDLEGNISLEQAMKIAKSVYSDLYYFHDSTITDKESGISTIVTVFVQDDYANTYSYAINNIASFYPNNDFEKNIKTNIYDLNGLYINDCTKSTNSYNISFDVYNSKYYSGAVDIYYENGMWIGYEEIDKYSNISGTSWTRRCEYHNECPCNQRVKTNFRKALR